MKGMRVRIKLGVFKEVNDLLDSLYFLSVYEGAGRFHCKMSSGFFSRWVTVTGSDEYMEIFKNKLKGWGYEPSNQI